MKPEDALRRAKELARLPYSVQVALDRTVDGKGVYAVSHPEFVGCIAQGDTVEEATSQLHDATIDYIASLLEDDLPIPGPANHVTETSRGEGSSIDVCDVEFVSGQSRRPNASSDEHRIGGTFSAVRT